MSLNPHLDLVATAIAVQLLATALPTGRLHSGRLDPIQRLLSHPEYGRCPKQAQSASNHPMRWQWRASYVVSRHLRPHNQTLSSC